MHFSVLGACPSLLPLLRCLEPLGHQCVATSDLGRWDADVRELTPEAVRDVQWELLLSPPPVELPSQTIDGLIYQPRIDAVIVALDSTADETERQRRGDQLRKLAGVGMPLLVLVPCCEGIVGYELDMIRRDTDVVLFPYSPLALHEGATRMRDMIADGAPEIGAIEQLVLERASPAESMSERLSQLAQDAHLLDGLLGGIVEVAASSSVPEKLENLAAHFQGKQCVARWSLLRGAPQQLQVTAIGERGRAVWNVCDDPTSAQFGHGTWKVLEAEQPLTDSSAEQTLRAFQASCEGSQASQVLAWDGACRASEVADYAPRSAQRGRAMAVQEQTPTEEDTFKGMMAAGSCGLLLLVLLVIVIVGVFESIRFPSQRSKYLQSRESTNAPNTTETNIPAVDGANDTPLWLRVWPVYPLVFFLALQLLRLVFWEARTTVNRQESSRQDQ